MSSNRDQAAGDGSDPRVLALARLAHGSLGQLTPAARARGLERMSERLTRRRRIR